MTLTRFAPTVGARAALALATCFWSAPALADYEPHQYTEPGSGLVLEYYLYVPEGYDPATKYPLLVLLHAAGQPEDLPRKLSKGWAPSFLDGGDDQKYPSFFLIPISQTNMSGWGDGLSNAEKFEGRLAVVVLKDIVGSGEYNIDADRLYVTGPSMGGRGTWDMIEKNPGLFAAAIPMAAPGLDDAKNVINENIWAVNGEKDSTVGDNRNTIAAIRAAGGNPIYTELAGHGHDTWRSIYPSDAFMQWVYAQRRGVPWWTVSEVPEVSEPLTPGQVVVSGPTEPSGGSGGGGGMAGSHASGSPSTAAAAGTLSVGGASPTGEGGHAVGGSVSVAGSTDGRGGAGSPTPMAGGPAASSGAPPLPSAPTDASCRLGRSSSSSAPSWALLVGLALASRLQRRA